MEPFTTEIESAPQTELEKSFWERRRKFPVQVETAFQAEMDHMRERRMRKTGLSAILLYGAFAFSDRVLIPDAYLQAWAIRFFGVVPLMLFCTFFVYRIPKAAWREALLSLTLIVTGISLPLIASFGAHSNATHYQTGVALIILFGNIVLNLRFRSALLTSAAMMILYGAALTWFNGMPLEARFNNWMFCLTAAIMSLIANFRTDQDQRRAYFARIREYERNKELSHAVELLAKLSAEDSLTQVANRREFDRRLAIEWGRARRDGSLLALIMVDVDCFKNYNDHYGHPAGDAVLQQIAACLRTVPRRAADLVSRFGGEEFAVLLPDTAGEDAVLLAERMRQAVGNLQIPHATSRVAPGITASFGVAAMQASGDTDASALVAVADAALYEAKRAGRHRVVLHGQEPGSMQTGA